MTEPIKLTEEDIENWKTSSLNECVSLWNENTNNIIIRGLTLEESVKLRQQILQWSENAGKFNLANDLLQFRERQNGELEQENKQLKEIKSRILSKINLLQDSLSLIHPQTDFETLHQIELLKEILGDKQHA